MINDGVAPSSLLLNFNFFCCGPARSGVSEDEDLRLFRRVEGAIMFTMTNRIVSAVDCENGKGKQITCVSLCVNYMQCRVALEPRSPLHRNYLRIQQRS